MAQEAKTSARNHKTTFRFFLNVSRDPWWGRQVLWLRIVGGPVVIAGVVLFCPFAGKNIVMVDDDTLVELWRRFLKDPRTSDAEIRRLSRLALLRYEDFRLQLIAWSLNPPASSLPNSAAMTSQLQHHEPVPGKDRAVSLECTECRARYIAVLSDDPPDWKPHCIECDTPFGPVLGRAVYSLFAVFD